MSALLAILIGTATVLYVALPLLRTRSAVFPKRGGRALLQEKKEALYREVKELEFDYHMGKLSQEDYENLRTHTLSQAAALVQKIEDEKRKRQDSCPACGTLPLPRARFCHACGARLSQM